MQSPLHSPGLIILLGAPFGKCNGASLAERKLQTERNHSVKNCCNIDSQWQLQSQTQEEHVPRPTSAAMSVDPSLPSTPHLLTPHSSPSPAVSQGPIFGALDMLGECTVFVMSTPLSPGSRESASLAPSLLQSQRLLFCDLVLVVAWSLTLVLREESRSPQIVVLRHL